MDIGEKIRLARVVKGYSQEYMAKKLEITQKTYSLIESNQTKLDIQKLKEIAALVELGLEDLLSLDENNILENNISGKKKHSLSHSHQPFRKERVLYEKQIGFLETQLEIMQKERNSLIKLLDKCPEKSYPA